MLSVLMTSTMKSDPSGACARGNACGVPTSAAAIRPEGGSTDGVARPGPIGKVSVAAALATPCAGTAVAAPAIATPVRNLRRFTCGRGSFRAMVFSLDILVMRGGLDGQA